MLRLGIKMNTKVIFLSMGKLKKIDLQTYTDFDDYMSRFYWPRIS
jgi:hypothetical protein